MPTNVESAAPIIDDRASLELFVDELVAIEARVRNLEHRARTLRTAIGRAMSRARIAEVTTSAGSTAKLVANPTVEVG